MVLRAGLQAGLLNQSSAQVIDGSLKFDDARNTRLKRYVADGNRRTFTFSCWVKRGVINATPINIFAAGSNNFRIALGAGDGYFQVYNYNGSSHDFIKGSTAMYRDTGWYHLVVAVDSPTETANDRFKIYVNGEQITALTNGNTNPSLDKESYVNDSNNPHYLGYIGADGYDLDAYLSQAYFIDGKVLDPSYFGFTDPLTNTWRPKKFDIRTEVKKNLNDGTTWSNFLTTNAGDNFDGSGAKTKAFDGNGSNKAYTANNSDGTTQDTSYLEMVFPTAISGALRVKCDNGNTVRNTTGGGDVLLATQGTGSDNKFVDCGTVSGLTNLRVLMSGGSRPAISMIELDGYVFLDGKQNNSFYLPMDGNSPVGEDKSGIRTINDGTMWSSYVTASNTMYNYDGAAMFLGDGNTGFDGKLNTRIDDWNGQYNQNASYQLEFVPPTPIPYKYKVEVYTVAGPQSPYNNDFYIDTGSGYGSAIDHVQNSWVTLATGSGSVTKIKSTATQNGTSWTAIKIDGVILVNNVKGNDFTPTNFGGSVALDNSQVSGARPILNTTQGGSQAGVGVLGSKENKFYTVTTANGSVYQFDITSGNNPSLEFIRGATYKFDYSSHTGHPVLFSSTNPDSSTTAYTDGTSTASNVISFTVPHNAPDTLYYYCANHPTAMNGAISVTTDETKADLYAWKNVLALPLVGSGGDVSNQINSGSTTKTFTTTGAVASGAKSNFYNGSFSFDGSDDRLVSATSSDFTFGTGSFTVEGWVYPETNNANKTIFSTNWGANGSFIITYSHPQSASAAGRFAIFDHSQNNGQPTLATIHQYPVNNWYHVAFVRNGNSHKFYINGIEAASNTYTASNLTRDVFVLGAVYTTGGETFDGFIQDVRVYKGAAKYTNNFVPPSISPDVLSDTPSGVSGGSKLAKITDGAVAFDGSGDYLTLADSTDFDFGTGDYTAEAYFYPKSHADMYIINQTTDHGGAAPWWGLNVWSNGSSFTVRAGRTDSSGNAKHEISYKWATHKWTHMAVSRVSGTSRLYIDGVLLDTQSDTDDIDGNGSLYVGAYNDGSLAWNGFISNVRIVKGTGVYTEPRITPPTAPLTNVTNTKVLCCQSTIEPGAAAVAPNVSGSINAGTQWSNYLVSPNYAFMTNNPPTRAFNGLNTYGQTPPNSSTPNGRQYDGGSNNNPPSVMIFNPPGGLAYSSEVSIDYECHGPISIELNGTEVISLSGPAKTASGFSALASGSGTITEIKLTSSGASGDYVSLYAIKVDGTVLKDPLAPSGDAAATNFNPFNTDINTVRGQETGYATMNPLNTQGLTLSDGNLNVTNMGSSRQVHANIFVNSGKWYAEFTCKAAMNDTLFGVANVNGTSFLGSDTNSWGVISINGNRIHDQNGSGGQSSYGSSFTTGDVISVALDMDSGKWYAAKNGVYFDGGNPLTGANPAYSGLTGELTFAVGSNNTGGDVSCNFGQKPFKFPPPDGFQPLNAANVRPETVIARPDQYFNITEWSGDNTDPKQINLGMSPDLIWVKTRNQTNWHWLSDSLRGTADKRYKLYSNSPNAEDTAPIYGQADSFNDFGFVAGGGTDGSNPLSDSNQTGTNYICWSWKAGGSKFTYNKDGSGGSSASDIGVSATTLTLTGASINTTSKFGIYTYTGSGSGSATITHNLGGTPAFVVYKKRTGSSSWQVYHKSLGGTKYMNWDENTDAYTSDSTRFGGTDPTSTTITLGTHANGATTTVLYAWCDVPGLQKFGTYTGGGSGRYPFVELGFRPAMIWIKDTTTGGTHYDWKIYDSKRNPFNLGADNADSKNVLYINTNDQENKGSSAWEQIDFLSNGFRMNDASVSVNQSGSTYIYCAWAEAPVSNLYGGSANAF